MPSLRSALASSFFAATVVASIASSNPSPDPAPGIGLHLEQQGQVTLTDAEPRATARYIATLGALANPALADGGLPTSASLRLTWLAIELTDGGSPEDAGLLHVNVSFGGDAGTSLTLFPGCQVGTQCSQPVDIDFALGPDGPRTVSVTWSITGEAHGDALNPTPVGASFTLDGR